MYMTSLTSRLLPLPLPTFMPSPLCPAGNWFNLSLDGITHTMGFYLDSSICQKIKYLWKTHQHRIPMVYLLCLLFQQSPIGGPWPTGGLWGPKGWQPLFYSTVRRDLYYFTDSFISLLMCSITVWVINGTHILSIVPDVKKQTKKRRSSKTNKKLIIWLISALD